MIGKYCAECGQPLKADALYCNTCGARVLEVPSEEPDMSGVPAAPAQLTDTQGQAVPAAEEMQRVKGKIPEEAHRIARSLQMGEPEASYASISMHDVLLVLGVTWALLAVFAVLGVALASPQHWWWGLLIALPIPLLYLLSVIFGRKYRAYVCADGFIYCAGTEISDMRWDEVIEVKRSTVAKYRSRGGKTNLYFCTVSSAERKIALSSEQLLKTRELYDTIEQKVARYKTA